MLAATLVAVHIGATPTQLQIQLVKGHIFHSSRGKLVVILMIAFFLDLIAAIAVLVMLL